MVRLECGAVVGHGERLLSSNDFFTFFSQLYENRKRLVMLIWDTRPERVE